MDDLQLKVSSSDRYLVRRNGDLGLDPVVRRIRDLTMFGSSHERERTIPFSGKGCNHKEVIGGVGGSESTCGISRYFRRRSKNGSEKKKKKENSQQAGTNQDQ